MSLLNIKRSICHFVVKTCLLTSIILSVSCNSHHLTDDGRPKTETIIRGVAAMNTSGAIVEARSFKDDSIIGNSIKTDEAGNYALRLKSATGDIVVSVCGGSYIDMVSGASVDIGQECLRGMATDVKLCEERELNIGPFSEILYSYARAKGVDDSKKMKNHLEIWLGDNDDTTRSAAFSDPEPDMDAEKVGVTPRAMAFLIAGGISQLAYDLGLRLDSAHPLNLTAFRLVKTISEDISDGVIDGYKNGKRLFLPENSPLPSGLLRQPLAQSIRKFILSENNKSGLTYESVSGPLDRLSSDDFSALGPSGHKIDTEGPETSITQINNGDVVASHVYAECHAVDPSGVKSISMSLYGGDSNELLASQTADFGFNGKSKNIVSVNLPTERMRSGRHSIQCQSLDVWGNAGDSRTEFSVNMGDVLPNVEVVSVRPGPGGELAGQASVRCRFDDPHVVSITASVSKGSNTVEFPSVSTNQFTEFQWNTDDDDDGLYSVRCSAFTQGYEEPRVSSLNVRVRNHEMGVVSGVVFIGAPIDNVDVSAFAWGSNGSGARVGGPVSLTRGSGEFVLPISNEYRGPLLVEAHASSSPEGSVSMQSIVFRDHRQELSQGFKISTLVEHYSPGERIGPRTINAATTVAVYLASKISSVHENSGVEPFIRIAFQEASRLVSPNANLDLLRSQVPDLTRNCNGVSTDRMSLGLFHAGLAAMAAEDSRRERNIRDHFTIENIIALVGQRISDSAVVGHESDGATSVRFTEAGADLLRWKLARSTFRWLRSNDSESYMYNQSGIEPSYGVNSEWLASVSQNRSPVFGDHVSMPFDSEGPSISVRCKTREGIFIDCGNTFKDYVEVLVEAMDPSGVRTTEVFQDNRSLSKMEGGNNDVSDYMVTVSPGFMGMSSVLIRSEDSAGNVSEERIGLRFDNQEIIITPLNDDVYTQQEDSCDVDIESTKGITQVFVRGEKVDRGEHQVNEYTEVFDSLTRIRLPLRIHAGDGTYRFEVEARDGLSNYGRSVIYVHANSLPLAMETRPLSFVNQDGNTSESVGFGTSTRLVFSDVDLDPYHWTEGNKGWPSWEIKSARGSIDSRHDDHDWMRMSYRYSILDRGVQHQGHWRSIDVDAEHSFSGILELNFSTMLESIYDRQSSTISPNENVVYLASDYAIHTLDVRCEDNFGGEITQSWEFSLDLKTPPVHLSLEREVPPEGTSHRDLTVQQVLGHAGTGVKVRTSFFGGLRRSDEESAHPITLIPGNGAVIINIPDFMQLWTAYHKESKDIAFQIVQKFGLGEIVIGRGENHWSMASISAFPEEDLNDFVEHIRECGTHLVRTVLSSDNLREEHTPKKFAFHRPEVWNRAVSVRNMNGEQSGRRVPDVIIDDKSIMERSPEAVASPWAHILWPNSKGHD